MRYNVRARTTLDATDKEAHMPDKTPDAPKVESIEKHRKAKGRPTPGSPLDSIQDAVEECRNGRFVIIVDDEDRENEGDLVIAGEFATQENLAFMLRYTSGVICVRDERPAPRQPAHPDDGAAQPGARSAPLSRSPSTPAKASPPASPPPTAPAPSRCSPTPTRAPTTS